MKVVAIVSGGMDSVTLAHYLADKGDDLYLLSVNYGQRHKKELAFAERCATRLGAEWKMVDLSSINQLLQGSALTDDSVEVPEGHYAHPTMAKTVVPNRNAIMLSVAVGWAISLGAQQVLTAVHAGDHPVYPDCRPEFMATFRTMARVATSGFHVKGFRVEAPFLNKSKADIARIGDELGVPWEETWSCYKGSEIHCGKCGTCVERREAFELAGVVDPTEYEATPRYEEPEKLRR